MSIAIGFAAGLLAAIGSTAIYYRNTAVAVPVISGIVFYFFGYILCCMGWFVADAFSLERAVWTTAAVLAAVLAVLLLLLKRKEGVILPKLRWNWDLRLLWVPLVVTLLALPLVLTKNELFGMGQDQGVYQVVAINLMNGIADRQQDFAEYHLLPPEQQPLFSDLVRSYFTGYDIGSANYPETVYDYTISPVSGIYHGIPTYAAMLALFGKLFGIPHMIQLETVCWVCMIFLVSFICRQLQWKQLTEFLACAVSAASPVVIWVTKSSLTEAFLMVIMTAFLCLLTDPYRSHWLSLLPIAVFGCYHVSIYTMVPLFVVLYGALYLFRRKPMYAVMMSGTVILYFFSYFAMRHVQPFYTMNNYRSLFVGGITVFHVTGLVIAVSAAALLFCSVYCFLLWRRSAEFSESQFLKQIRQKPWVTWMFLGFLVLPVLYILIAGILRYHTTTLGHLRWLTLVGYADNTGFFLLPVACLVLLLRRKRLLEQTNHLIFYAAFLYCIVFYAAALRFRIEYYYYYSRYLAPFIPVAVLFAAMVLDDCRKRVVVPVLTAGLLVVSPFDAFLATAKDDTRLEWDVLEDTAKQITERDCVIVEKALMSQLYLPIRAMTGAAMYPKLTQDIGEQVRQLRGQYETVYYLTEDSLLPYLCVYRNTSHHSEDDLNHHGKLLPMPLEFLEYDETVSLYQCARNQLVYTATECSNTLFSGFGQLENGFCWSVAEEASVFCTLSPGAYTMEITMGCALPLKQLQAEEWEIAVFVNHEQAGTLVITPENNGGVLQMEIPAELLREEQNQITLQTPLWKAAMVTPNDTRELGIPLQEVEFLQK